MGISIFGYKLNLEVLILIGVIYLILVGHTLCGCSNYTLMEGLEIMETAVEPIKKAIEKKENEKEIEQFEELSAQDPTPAGNVASGNAKNGASKVNGKAGKEGFVGANTNYGQSSPFDLASNSPIDTSSWSAQDMTVIPGKPLSPGVKQFLAREPQPVPLPEGEMLMFANTPFKPECCPNTYSNSSGCACMTGPQYNALVTRFGNNVPYSEY